MSKITLPTTTSRNLPKITQKEDKKEDKKTQQVVKDAELPKLNSLQSVGRWKSANYETTPLVEKEEEKRGSFRSVSLGGEEGQPKVVPEKPKIESEIAMQQKERYEKRLTSSQDKGEENAPAQKPGSGIKAFLKKALKKEDSKGGSLERPRSMIQSLSGVLQSEKKDSSLSKLIKQFEEQLSESEVAFEKLVLERIQTSVDIAMNNFFKEKGSDYPSAAKFVEKVVLDGLEMLGFQDKKKRFFKLAESENFSSSYFDQIKEFITPEEIHKSYQETEEGSDQRKILSCLIGGKVGLLNLNTLMDAGKKAEWQAYATTCIEKHIALKLRDLVPQDSKRESFASIQLKVEHLLHGHIRQQLSKFTHSTQNLEKEISQYLDDNILIHFEVLPLLAKQVETHNCFFLFKAIFNAKKTTHFLQAYRNLPKTYQGCVDTLLGEGAISWMEAISSDKMMKSIEGNIREVETGLKQIENVTEVFTQDGPRARPYYLILPKQLLDISRAFTRTTLQGNKEFFSLNKTGLEIPDLEDWKKNYIKKQGELKPDLIFLTWLNWEIEKAIKGNSASNPDDVCQRLSDSMKDFWEPERKILKESLKTTIDQFNAEFSKIPLEPDLKFRTLRDRIFVTLSDLKGVSQATISFLQDEVKKPNTYFFKELHPSYKMSSESCANDILTHLTGHFAFHKFKDELPALLILQTLTISAYGSANDKLLERFAGLYKADLSGLGIKPSKSPISSSIYIEPKSKQFFVSQRKVFNLVTITKSKTDVEKIEEEVHGEFSIEISIKGGLNEALAVSSSLKTGLFQFRETVSLQKRLEIMREVCKLLAK